MEEGSLYPALQKALANGWLKADWTTSDTGRQVSSYRITAKGQKQLETEQDDYQRMADAIAAISRPERHKRKQAMSTWFRRVWHLVNRPRHERDLVREMHDHRESMHDPSRFGDTHRLLEQSRDAWGWNWLDDAMQDFAVGVRTLLRSPSFAMTATLILAFGIGLNVTLYQMVQAALLRPPAIKSADWVARFLRVTPHSSSTSVPYPLAEFVKQNNSVLAAVMVEARIERRMGPGCRRTDRSVVCLDELVRRVRLRPDARPATERCAGCDAPTRRRSCLAILSGNRGSAETRTSLARPPISIANR